MFTVGYQNDSAELLRLHVKKAGIAILDLKISSEILPEIQNILTQYIED
jgi:hypothetical protein